MSNLTRYNPARPRALIESKMEQVLEKMDLLYRDFECLLVGVKLPENGAKADVCVDSANNKWNTEVFRRLSDAAMSDLARDSRYTRNGNTSLERDRIKREAVRDAVKKTLPAYDAEHDLRSFSGWPGQLGEYYVVPVLQFPEDVFRRFPPLRELPAEHMFSVPPSFIHAAIEEVLSWAHEEIREEVPGGGLMGRSPSPEEMARTAATLFLYAPGRAIGDNRFAFTSLFERLNSLSTWLYEGTRGTGRLLLTQPSGKGIDMTLRFATPVPLEKPRWGRKVLQMASSDLHLVADTQSVWGLGRLAEKIDPWQTQDVFAVDFLDHYHWRLVCGDKTLLVCQYAVPILPNAMPSLDSAKDQYSSTFPSVSKQSTEWFSDLYMTAAELDHGSMLVVAQDAEREAKRLEHQGTRIRPVLMTPNLFRHVSRIDGSVLVDPEGVCHAVGVILDGEARPDCLPARGARYNSAVRYIRGAAVGRLAVVVSDDRTVEVVSKD